MLGGSLVTTDGMVCPQFAGGGDGLQIWRVPANILNKWWRTADKGWSDYGLNDRRVRIRVLVGSEFSRCPDRLWSPPASPQMGTGGSFPGSKAAGA
jgi:hypothetical protein